MVAVVGPVIECDWYGCRTRAAMAVPGEISMSAPGFAYEIRRRAAAEGWRTAEGTEGSHRRLDHCPLHF
jgi:hypothetical protein